MMSQQRVTGEDIAAIAGYFVVVLGVGIWASVNASKGNIKGYFLAGQKSNWFLVGASTFATNIGASSFIGLAGAAASSGIAIVMFEWHAMIMLIALGWVFMPVYRACGCYTMPQYLKLRFGGNRLRVLLACIRISSGIISTIAGQMYAGALFINQLLGWNIYISVFCILVVTAVYTTIGGLKAVLWTDALQAVILIGGSSTLAIICLIKVGGWEGIQAQYPLAAANYTLSDQALYGNRSCGMPRQDAFHIFRSANADYPWPGMLGGLTLLAITGWCTDQIVVQRSLSARSVSDVKGGLVFTAYLKILSFFFFVMPGLISRIFYPEEVACADPDSCQQICGNPAGCSNIAYPLLVLRELPNGFRGLMMAALLAALMSSLTSIFNSSAAIFTMDVYHRIRRRATQKELMVVGRVYTIILVCISFAWIPMLQNAQGASFWNYIQGVLSTLVPPTVSVYLTGIFWLRTTEAGAFSGMLLGLVVGVTRLALSWAGSGVPCGGSGTATLSPLVTGVHYLHFAMINAALCIFIIVCVSLLTAPRPASKLRRVTFWTKHDPELPEVSDSEDEDEDNDETKESPPGTDEGDGATRKSTVKRLLLRVLCGIDDKPVVKETKEEIQERQRKTTSITEDPKLKNMLHIQAIIALGVCVFLHGFFA